MIIKELLFSKPQYKHSETLSTGILPMSNHWSVAEGVEWTIPIYHLIFKSEKLVKWKEGEYLPNYKKKLLSRNLEEPHNNNITIMYIDTITDVFIGYLETVLI